MRASTSPPSASANQSRNCAGAGLGGRVMVAAGEIPGLEYSDILAG